MAPDIDPSQAPVSGVRRRRRLYLGHRHAPLESAIVMAIKMKTLEKRTALKLRGIKSISMTASLKGRHRQIV
jgi:hypothetical protein